MTSNKLKLNQAKTEFVMFGTKPQIKKKTLKYISVGNEIIPVKQHVQNLGAHFDVELKMSSHVNEIVKTGYYHLRQLRAPQKIPDQKCDEKFKFTLRYNGLWKPPAAWNTRGAPEQAAKAPIQRGAPYYRAKFARSHNGHPQSPALAPSPLQNSIQDAVMDV